MVYKSIDWFDEIECQLPHSDAWGFAFRSACESTLQKILTMAGLSTDEKILFELITASHSYRVIARYFGLRSPETIHKRWVKLLKKLELFRKMVDLSAKLTRGKGGPAKGEKHLLNNKNGVDQYAMHS